MRADWGAYVFGLPTIACSSRVDGRFACRSLSALVILGLAAAVSGCDIGVSWHPFSISRDGSDLLVAVCEDMTIETAFGLYYADDSAKEDVIFWDSSGTQKVKAGDVISPTADVPGVETSVAMSPRWKPDDWIEIVFNLGDANAQGSAQGAFHVGQDGLAEGTWLHSDGELATEPCPSNKNFYY